MSAVNELQESSIGKLTVDFLSITLGFSAITWKNRTVKKERRTETNSYTWLAENPIGPAKMH